MNKTSIAWTEKTVNPIVGCTKVSEGCRNCYAEKLFGLSKHDHPFDVPTFYPERLKDFEARTPTVIFVCSMSDLFHETITTEVIDQIISAMVRNRQHRYIILTKRARRMREYFESCERGATETGRAFPWSHIWIGISAEDQRSFDERVSDLIWTPGIHKLVSLEPLIGPIDLTGAVGDASFEWVITGGETGPGARMLRPEWIYSLISQCVGAHVPIFFKSWGEFDYSGDRPFRVGKDRSENYVHGVKYEERPAELKGPEQESLF